MVRVLVHAFGCEKEASRLRWVVCSKHTTLNDCYLGLAKLARMCFHTNTYLRICARMGVLPKTARHEISDHICKRFPQSSDFRTSHKSTHKVDRNRDREVQEDVCQTVDLWSTQSPKTATISPGAVSSNIWCSVKFKSHRRD